MSAAPDKSAAAAHPADQPSSPAQKVSAYVTGYGPFANIKINPSTTVAKHVAAGLKRRGDIAAVHLTELETSIAAASVYFDELEQALDKALAEDPSQKFLLFHVGVHSMEKNGVMRVETVGYNELHASVPDVRGVVFNHDVIHAGDGDCDAHLTTFFAEGGAPLTKLKGIVEALNEQTQKRAARKGFQSNTTDAHSLPHRNVKAANDANGGRDGGGGGDARALEMPEFQVPTWILSDDAGRYLCNYCLYRSLKLQQKYRGREETTEGEGSTLKAPPVVGVFIHVCDPTQGKDGDKEGVVERYNPSVMEQSQQTELLAHELMDWMIAA